MVAIAAIAVKLTAFEFLNVSHVFSSLLTVVNFVLAGSVVHAFVASGRTVVLTLRAVAESFVL